MKNPMGKRLTQSWLAGVAVAALVLLPLKLGVIDRIFTTPDLQQAVADYLLTTGFGYFIGVFVSLPVFLLTGIVVKMNHARIANRVGLWSASGAMILATGATIALHLTPAAHAISSELQLSLTMADTLGFFLISFGVSALAYQVHDHLPDAEDRIARDGTDDATPPLTAQPDTVAEPA